MMTRLSHDPQVVHFSHSHPLNLTILGESQPHKSNPTPCSGCRQRASGYMYSCEPCNFALHLNCFQLPQLISHPCHPNHDLNLLPVSSYPGGIFSCDACSHRGSGFSYHCNICDFDLHVLCACMQLSITHHRHSHPLDLTFDSPYDTRGFSCDVCRRVCVNQWLYRCQACQFDVHLECATGISTEEVVQPQPQPHRSCPGPTHIPLAPPPVPAGHGMANHVPHSLSTGTLQPGYNQPPRPLSHSHSAPNGSRTNFLLNAMLQGAAQQVGETLVQTVFGGDGVSSSSPIVDAASAIFSGGDSGTQS